MLKFSQLSVAVGIAALSGLTFGFVSGKTDPQSRYHASVQRIDKQFQTAQSRCQTLPRDQLRLCLAVALSEKWRGMADAQVKLNDTPETRRSQRVIAAGGALLVALQKCTVRAPGERDTCRDSAKDSFLREVSRARMVEARERPCYPAECAWLPEPARRLKTTSV
jgi:hypothetical protein